jgi:hypothetical protein
MLRTSIQQTSFVKLALTAILAGAMIAPTAQAQTTVKIAAAMVFGTDASGGLRNAITAFQTANPTYANYTFTIVPGMTTALATRIECYLQGPSCANYTASDNFSLFLAANTSDPDALYNGTYGQAGLVYCLASPYPTDCSLPVSNSKPLLWSNKTTVNATNGLGGLTSSNTFAICSTSEPYGQFAQTQLTAAGFSNVTTYMGLMMVDTNTANQTQDAGFVAAAQHCDGSGNVTFSSYPNATWYLYSDVEDHGAVLISSGSATADAAAQAFLQWLTTNAGQTALQQQCLHY